MPINTISKTNKSCEQWADELNNKLEDLDRGLRLVGMEGLAGIVYHSSVLSGRAVETAAKIGNPLTTARIAPSMAKSCLRAFDVFSGNMFARWKQKATRWINIAIDIAITVARFFNPINWLHRIKAIDLGKHAGWVNIMVTVGFTATTVLCFMDATDSFIKSVNENSASRNEKAAKLAFNFFDMLASPWENGVGFNSSPTMSLVGAVLSAVACGGHFLCEWFAGSRLTAQDLINERIKINDLIPSAPGFDDSRPTAKDLIDERIKINDLISAAPGFDELPGNVRNHIADQKNLDSEIGKILHPSLATGTA